MAIKVKFFASMREWAGVAELDLELADITASEAGCTMADVLQHCAVGKAEPLNAVICAVNYATVDDNATVEDGDEVAFFPPVTGG